MHDGTGNPNLMAARPALRVASLTYDAGDARLIDIPALELAEQGITVVMGPNGAGKSLLLRLLHGLIVPSGGRVSVGLEPLSPRICKRQALVFQKPVLLRRSVAANVDFVLKARGKDRAARERLLDLVGLGPLSDRPARRLSGGEQQRLAIAKALATEPVTLFMDEPTASLDPASVQAIEAIVTRVAGDGVRVIFVSHDVAQARRLARDVVFMNKGRVAEHAMADQFFEQPETEAARAYLAGRLVA
ncbi:MAG: ATP-binding cassette domain-containing protein [Silicimonas sp.]|nr:ATP-binding cassette domain-containing protein [Silicimonas sp.]